jgi:hypothetical protein
VDDGGGARRCSTDATAAAAAPTAAVVEPGCDCTDPVVDCRVAAKGPEDVEEIVVDGVSRDPELAVSGPLLYSGPKEGGPGMGTYRGRSTTVDDDL